MIERYLVVAGDDGFQSVLCESLEAARAEFIELHLPANADETEVLRAYFDDEDNWSFFIGVGETKGCHRERLRVQYEWDFIEVTRVTALRPPEKAQADEKLRPPE